MDFFSGTETIVFFSSRKDALKKEVSEMRDSDISSCDLHEWTAYLENKYEVIPIRLFEESITQSISETKVKKYNKFSRHNSYEPEYFLIDGICVSYLIPFDGDSELFQLQPSTLILTRFTVNSFHKPFKEECGTFTLCNEFTKSELQDKGSEMQKYVAAEFEKEFKNYRIMISYVNNEVESFNKSLSTYALNCLKERKEKASAFAEISKLLEIPLHQNVNAPNVIPVKLTKVTRTPVQKPKSKPLPAEYMIKDSDYENINNIIMMCGTTMEQTARTYFHNNEEELRDHLLAALNTHYDNATGETFRKIGKTDINISFENKAAFIGECKIWHGEKLFVDAVEQVMNYSTWKDIKMSVIIFNKDNQSFQSILPKISLWIDQNTKSYTKPKVNSWDCVYYRKDMQVDVKLNIVAFDLYVDAKQFRDNRSR